MAKRPELTPSEYAIVQLGVDAKTNYEIARALDLSIVTVKRRLTSVMIKWDAPNRVGIAVKAVRDGVVQ